jgi:hypothetical protein
MKNLIKLFLIIITFIFFLKSIAREREAIVQKFSFTSLYHNFQDTAFIRNYIAANKIGFLYAKPNLASKTKIRIPKNVGITTIRRSGNFEYGDFSVSSNKSYKGWFLISDLQGIIFTPPKTN